MAGVEAVAGAGLVVATTYANRGMTPDEIADMMMPRIIYLGDHTVEPLRAQVQAFKDDLRRVLVHYLKIAQGSQRSTIYCLLRDNGHLEAAEIIMKLGNSKG